MFKTLNIALPREGLRELVALRVYRNGAVPAEVERVVNETSCLTQADGHGLRCGCLLAQAYGAGSMYEGQNLLGRAMAFDGALYDVALQRGHDRAELESAQIEVTVTD